MPYAHVTRKLTVIDIPGGARIEIGCISPEGGTDFGGVNFSQDQGKVRTRPMRQIRSAPPVGMTRHQ